MFQQPSSVSGRGWRGAYKADAFVHADVLLGTVLPHHLGKARLSHGSEWAGPPGNSGVQHVVRATPLYAVSTL